MVHPCKPNKQIRSTSERTNHSAKQKHQKTQTSNKRVPTKSYQWTISWQRSASESKRRCLSSLQFSPLNLSWVHPCKPNKQNQTERANNIWTHNPLIPYSDQYKTKALTKTQTIISWQRSASESKRRCLSSLQFSPLNLSWVHPCKPNKQIRFNCISMQKSDQCKTKASKNRDQQQEGTNQKLPMDHKLTKVCIRK